MCKPSVWPDEYVNGIKSIDGPHLTNSGESFVPQIGHKMSLKEALETEHPLDAHITTYAVIDGENNPVEAHPLIKKACLPYIKEAGGGYSHHMLWP